MGRQPIRRLIVAGFITVVLSSAAAGDVTAAAEQGDPDAQFLLGRAYQFGEEDGGRLPGIPRDDDQALTWIRKAADQGLPQAQFWLGKYWRGDHGRFANAVVPDPGRALAWFRRAAEQGHPHSQYLLGEAYYDGDKGVIRDYSEAAAWFQKAAELGHSLAQRNLSTCYWFGEGVSRDKVRAYAWENLAATRSRYSVPSFPQTILDLMEDKMSPAQIEEAQAASRELVERVPVLEDFQQYGGFHP